MFLKIKGHDGEYVIKNGSNILQYKFDKNGSSSGETVVHIITDSIENKYDRIQVSQKIKEYQLYY